MLEFALRQAAFKHFFPIDPGESGSGLLYNFTEVLGGLSRRSLHKKSAAALIATH